MKATLAVTRFSNEDVIATSGAFNPDPGTIIIPDGVCAHVSTLHFFTTGRGTYNAATNMTTAPGVSYVYQEPGVMVFDGSVSSISVPGDVTISARKFYYFDGNTYQICDPQAHAR